MKDRTYDRLLFVDTETGGIDVQKHSLLSIGCVVWDRKLGIVEKREYYVKQEKYVTTKEAEKINKFDEVEHHKKAIEGKEIIADMLDFVYKYFSKDMLIPLAGHNTQFDVGFIKKFLKDNGRSFNSIFSHRIIDTYSIVKFLEYAGMVDANISSSAQALTYFKINVDNRHTALADAEATVKLFESMLKTIEK